MIRILIFIGILHTSEKFQNFNIEFLGINAANVEISIIDTVINSDMAKSIHFTAISSKFMNYFFQVDNYYHIITSNNFSDILYFSKKTSQPNVINNIITYNDDGNIIYAESNINIPKQTFNIFSLLTFLCYNKLNSITQMKIEREGILYNGEIHPIDKINDNMITYEINFSEKDISKNSAVIHNTDIFTWALFKDGATRHITIDYSQNIISQCIFKKGFIKMKAFNMNYK